MRLNQGAARQLPHWEASASVNDNSFAFTSLKTDSLISLMFHLINTADIMLSADVKRSRFYISAMFYENLL